MREQSGNPRPLIAVLGATDAQGNGLVRAILADPARTYAVRAITRSPDRPAARALSAAGAEIVYGDFDDRSSLVDAVAGAQGLFAAMPGPEQPAPGRARAGNIAQAARRAGVTHVILSAPDVLGSHLRVPGAHGEVFAGLPVSFLRPAFCWDNLIRFRLGPRRDADGVLRFVLPMGERKLPGIAAADVGRCALGLFRRGRSAVGCSIGLSGDHLSGADMAAEMARVLCEPVRHVSLPFAEYAALEVAGSQGARLLQYPCEFNAECCASFPIEQARELHPGVLNFREWLESNVQHAPPRRSFAPQDDVTCSESC